MQVTDKQEPKLHLSIQHPAGQVDAAWAGHINEDDWQPGRSDPEDGESYVLPGGPVNARHLRDLVQT